MEKKLQMTKIKNKNVYNEQTGLYNSYNDEHWKWLNSTWYNKQIDIMNKTQLWKRSNKLDS